MTSGYSENVNSNIRMCTLFSELPFNIVCLPRLLWILTEKSILAFAHCLFNLRYFLQIPDPTNETRIWALLWRARCWQVKHVWHKNRQVNTVETNNGLAPWWMKVLGMFTHISNKTVTVRQWQCDKAAQWQSDSWNAIFSSISQTNVLVNVVWPFFFSIPLTNYDQQVWHKYIKS